MKKDNDKKPDLFSYVQPPPEPDPPTTDPILADLKWKAHEPSSPDHVPRTPLPKAHARHGDPETSHEAAAIVTPTLIEKQIMVLRYAAARPDGFTHHALQTYFGNSGATYRTRCAELVEKGYITRTDRKEVVNGTKRLVWQITQAGLDRLKELDG